jgi:hypothetical protein
MTEPRLINGSCLCGAIAYPLDSLDMPIVHCHCLSCQVDASTASFIGNYNPLDGAIPAQIRSHSLLGNVIRYRVEARGVELLMDVPNRSAADLFAPGQPIALTNDAHALREVA